MSQDHSSSTKMEGKLYSKNTIESATILYNPHFATNSRKPYDTVILIEDQEFPVHKDLLCSNSTYFTTMFNGNFCESNQRKVGLHGVESEEFVLILEYLYQGQLTVTRNNMLNVLKTALYLQIESIVHSCEDFAASQIVHDNCLEIYQFAEINNCETLEQKAKQYIIQNFPDVAFYDDFGQFHFEEVQKIVSDGQITCPEIEIFLCVIKWVKYDTENRSQFLVKLLEHVCFPLISSYFFERFISTEPLVYNSPEIMELINKSLKPGGLVSHLVINRKVCDFSGSDQFFLL